MSEMNFSDLDSTAPESEDDDYDLDDFENVELDEAGDILIGELLDVLENVGQYDARIYLFETDDGKKMMFGNASADAGYDQIADDGETDADEIDVLGIQKTDRTYENDFGEFAQYEVRYSSETY